MYRTASEQPSQFSAPLEMYLAERLDDPSRHQRLRISEMESLAEFIGGFLTIIKWTALFMVPVVVFVALLTQWLLAERGML